MVDKCHFEALRSLVVVAVVKGLNVKEHCVAIVFPSFGTLQIKKNLFRPVLGQGVLKVSHETFL